MPMLIPNREDLAHMSWHQRQEANRKVANLCRIHGYQLDHTTSNETRATQSKQSFMDEAQDWLNLYGVDRDAQKHWDALKLWPAK